MKNYFKNGFDIFESRNNFDEMIIFITGLNSTALEMISLLDQVKADLILLDCLNPVENGAHFIYDILSREVLNYSKIQFISHSYGSKLAVEAMQLLPAEVCKKIDMLLITPAVDKSYLKSAIFAKITTKIPKFIGRPVISSTFRRRHSEAHQDFVRFGAGEFKSYDDFAISYLDSWRTRSFDKIQAQCQYLLRPLPPRKISAKSIEVVIAENDEEINNDGMLACLDKYLGNYKVSRVNDCHTSFPYTSAWRKFFTGKGFL